MIGIRSASPSELDTVLQLRYETMRKVCGFSADHPFSEEFYSETERYFRHGDHATVLAWDGETAIGCASICYISLMPTYSHPTGIRAHLMNVYVRESYRRQGIARCMLEQLITDAKRRGATELSLDTTAAGRPLYASLGFAATKEGMVKQLPRESVTQK